MSRGPADPGRLREERMASSRNVGRPVHLQTYAMEPLEGRALLNGTGLVHTSGTEADKGSLLVDAPIDRLSVVVTPYRAPGTGRSWPKEGGTYGIVAAR